MRQLLLGLIVPLVLSAAAWSEPQPVPHAPPPAPASKLTALLDEHFQQLMRDNPTTASLRGDDRYNDKLADARPEAIASQRDAYRTRLAALRALDRTGWNEQDILNADLLIYELDIALQAAAFFPEQSPLDDRQGPAIELAELAQRVPFSKPRHKADWVARLEAMPALIDQEIALMRTGLAAGRTPPRVVLGSTAGQARALALSSIAAGPTASPFYHPLATLPADNPLAVRARTAISTGIVPAFARLADFLEKEYVPHARESTAAIDGVDGLPFYEFQLRQHTTLPLSAAEIHALGLSEVARIKSEMLAAIARTDFPKRDELAGDALLASFLAYLRTDPRFYYADADSLLRGYRDIAKRIDGELPALFGKLPRNSYGVRPMEMAQAKTAPTAYYYPGSIRSGIAGNFIANTFRLDQRPKYEMISLTLHEAVPGHHLQISLCDELEGVHPFRTMAAPTAFVEGWGLYAERLGLEMAGGGGRLSRDITGGTGLFTDPYDDFGRLTYEMWRACRLVVDTGVHAMRWPRQRAIDFMLAHTALSELNIEREVDRYIGWPGQACGYKIGEMKIRELRRLAEDRLEPLGRWDIRAFHDALLSDGALPLAVLEKRMKRWIESRAVKP